MQARVNLQAPWEAVEHETGWTVIDAEGMSVVEAAWVPEDTDAGVCLLDETTAKTIAVAPEAIDALLSAEKILVDILDNHPAVFPIKGLKENLTEEQMDQLVAENYEEIQELIWESR